MTQHELEDDDDDDWSIIEREDELMAEKVIERLEYDVEVDALSQQLMDVLRPWLLQLAKRIAGRVTDEMVHEGMCSFSFHRSTPEWRSDGTCQSCGKPPEEHVLTQLCRAPFHEGDRIRHRIEMHLREKDRKRAKEG